MQDETGVFSIDDDMDNSYIGGDLFFEFKHSEELIGIIAHKFERKLNMETLPDFDSDLMEEAEWGFRAKKMKMPFLKNFPKRIQEVEVVFVNTKNEFGGKLCRVVENIIRQDWEEFKQQYFKRIQRKNDIENL